MTVIDSATTQSICEQLDDLSPTAKAMVADVVVQAIEKHNAKVTGDLHSKPTKELTIDERNALYDIRTIASGCCIVF